MRYSVNLIFKLSDTDIDLHVYHEVSAAIGDHVIVKCPFVKLPLMHVPACLPAPLMITYFCG